MSNRFYREIKVLSMEKDVKQIFAHVVFGATGAPTLDLFNSKGVASFTRISAGLYEITMGTAASSQAATFDVYKKLLAVSPIFVSTAAPAAPATYVASNTVTTNGKLRLQFNAAGVATDPAATEQVYLRFMFGDSNT